MSINEYKTGMADATAQIMDEIEREINRLHIRVEALIDMMVTIKTVCCLSMENTDTSEGIND